MKNLDLTITGLIYEGAATNDPADSIKVFNKLSETTLQGAVRLELPIANLTTDLAITLPANPSLYLIVLTDQPISIKLNGGSQALALIPRASGTKTLAHYYRGTLTGLSVTNASGTQANVDIIICNK